MQNKQTMQLIAEDLLPNETVVLVKDANAIMGVRESGLSRLMFDIDKLMWVVGMKGKESIGGRLYLTNYRLIFKSHSINRLRGKFSIFLPTIQEFKDTSFLITRKVTISTRLTKFDFIVWGIPELIKKAEEERAKFTEESIRELQQIALENFEKCGEGLQVFGGLENVNKIFRQGGEVVDLFKLATNPLEGLAAMAFHELFDKMVAEPWQKKFA